MSDSIVSRPTPWNTVILVCAKCSRKLDGGYGDKRQKSLRTALNDVLRETGRRRQVRVVETKCFGLCPKKAVVALNASHPNQMLSVPRGTAARATLDRLITDAGAG